MNSTEIYKQNDYELYDYDAADVDKNKSGGDVLESCQIIIIIMVVLCLSIIYLKEFNKKPKKKTDLNKISLSKLNQQLPKLYEIPTTARAQKIVIQCYSGTIPFTDISIIDKNNIMIYKNLKPMGLREDSIPTLTGCVLNLDREVEISSIILNCDNMIDGLTRKPEMIHIDIFDERNRLTWEYNAKIIIDRYISINITNPILNPSGKYRRMTGNAKCDQRILEKTIYKKYEASDF